MTEWKPRVFCDNEIADAIMNVACALSEVASAAHKIAYCLSYDGGNGKSRSVAESIEVAGEAVARAVAIGGAPE